MRSHVISVAGALAVMAAAFGLAACGGSTLGPGTFVCNTGTVQQLASPQQYQSGVSPSVGQIVVVAFGNDNTLYNTYSSWIVQLVDNTGTAWNGQPLQLVPDPAGPHPYTSDFYYGSSIPQLAPGRIYQARLVQPGAACRPLGLGSFAT